MHAINYVAILLGKKIDTGSRLILSHKFMPGPGHIMCCTAHTAHPDPGIEDKWSGNWT